MTVESWWAELSLHEKVAHVIRGLDTWGPRGWRLDDVDHHAATSWAWMPEQELSNLRLLKTIEAAFAADPDGEGVDEATERLGTSPELLRLKLVRWLGWYATDQARQVEACEALGLPWPPERPADSPGEWWPRPCRSHVFRWPWEVWQRPHSGGGTILPIVFPSTYRAQAGDPFVDRWCEGEVLVVTVEDQGRRVASTPELVRPEPLALPPEPLALPPEPLALPPEPLALPPAPRALGPGPKVAERETREERLLRGVWTWSDITTDPWSAW